MYWLSDLMDTLFSFHMKISGLRHFIFEGFNMAPGYINISLELVLNTLADTTYLLAAYTHVSRQET